ncbi:sugar ABC transporter permease (plasmid) [Deinococcus sp. KNUC1210]|uniref:carbohydrate ABC transporter permease n=1 Tax=Deinococcus sp. KNUC1210 TaxID=2917691 RepID=UPI001EF03373|nr:sugar ABC transporter permease [Deinococcus sp. KNUC1210]ULH14308.1 sugar ABC transporter permease [Deinococcus sp. KNUC1210]
MNVKSLRSALSSYVFLLPALVLLVVFTLYPVLYGSYLGFTEYTATNFATNQPPKWVGLDNFRTLANDDLFKTGVLNSLKYLLVVPALQLASLAVAVLVNRQLPFIAFFRAAYYVPVITSISLAAVMWDWIYNKDGTLNWLLKGLHLMNPNSNESWLLDPNTAFWAIMFVTFWKGFGYYMVLYMAGLQTIPEELEEAARLDGATPWHVFWRITVPLMQPTILLCSLLSTLSAIRVLEEVLVFTNGTGGPLNSTYTALLYVYKKSFGGLDFNYGLASAAGLVVAAIALILSVLNFRYFREGSARA